MPCLGRTAAAGVQIHQGKRERVKVRKVGAGGLEAEVGGGGEYAVQKVHQNVLGGFKRFVLPAGFDEKLFGKQQVDLPPGLCRNPGQVPVRIHADKVAQPDAAADQRCETPAEGTALRGDEVRVSCRERGTFADDGTDLVGDGTLCHGVPEQRITEICRAEIRRDAEGVVKHEQRAAQIGAGIRRQFFQVVLFKKFREQGGQIAGLPLRLLRLG